MRTEIDMAYLESRSIPEPNTGCWLWLGAYAPKGYGMLRRGDKEKKTWRANRAAWDIAYGQIPEGMYVLHRCDNPTCVNPKHLFLGTPADNSGDMVKKGRNRTGDRHPAVKIPRSSIAEIERLRTEGIDANTLAARFGVTRGCIYAHTPGKHEKPVRPCLECERKATHAGRCSMHYKRLWRAKGRAV